MEKEESEYEDVMALVKKTDKENPKPEDLTKMKRFLDKDSRLVELNDFSERAFSRTIELITTSALLKEIYRRQIEEKRESLGYQAASPIERILIDQVVICWFRLTNLEMTHAAKTYENHRSETGLYWDKRLNSAQRRFTRACESLAKVNKLLAEAELKEQQARNKRSQSTLIAQKILEKATK